MIDRDQGKSDNDDKGGRNPSEGSGRNREPLPLDRPLIIARDLETGRTNALPAVTQDRLRVIATPCRQDPENPFSKKNDMTIMRDGRISIDPRYASDRTTNISAEALLSPARGTVYANEYPPRHIEGTGNETGPNRYIRN